MMTVRFYIIPIEQVGNYRGPEYFTWRNDANPPSIDCPWNMIDYGLVNRAVIAADVTTTQHSELVTHGDVLALPVNLDQAMTQAAVNTSQTFLENAGVPAGWINTSYTYREVLRIVTSMFLYIQRVTAILEHQIVLTGGVLNRQMNEISAEIRDAMAQAADEMEDDYSWETGATTVRQLLKAMGDAWGDKPIYFG